MFYYEKVKSMLTVKEVAHLLHIHPNTVRRWSDQGILKSYRITRRGDRRFKQEDIAHFLTEYEELNSRKDGIKKAIVPAPVLRLP